MRKLLLVLLSLIPVIGLAQQRRNLLTDNYNRADIAKYCAYGFDWMKYPAYSDRAAWEKIPEAKRQATIAAGEKYLGYDWPNILPTMYLEFIRTGNRNIIDSAIGKWMSVLRALFFAELVEGKGRFLYPFLDMVFPAGRVRQGKPDHLGPPCLRGKGWQDPQQCFF